MLNLKKRLLTITFIVVFLLTTMIPSTLCADQATDVQNFVIRLYETCLGRGPDPEGLANWVNHLISGNISGGEAAYGFVFSQELQSRNLSHQQFLEVMYRAFFGREPDPGGFNNWMQYLASGNSREEVFSHFVNSEEFAHICASYGIDAGSINVKGSSKSSRPERDDRIKGSDQFYSLISGALNLLATYDPEAYAQYGLAKRIIETPQTNALASTDGKYVYIDLSQRVFYDIEFEREIACTLSHEFNHIANWNYYRSTGDRYGMEIMAFMQTYYTGVRLGMPSHYLNYIAWIIDNIYYLYHTKVPYLALDIIDN
ncbi:MAG: DUF4214 domain-containing protein [Actinomycetota bacterium]|jgi:hypothetical protein|nr:DUF4214 domain-containing protein [Actinomycetota bacterium]